MRLLSNRLLSRREVCCREERRPQGLGDNTRRRRRSSMRQQLRWTIVGAWLVCSLVLTPSCGRLSRSSPLSPPYAVASPLHAPPDDGDQPAPPASPSPSSCAATSPSPLSPLSLLASVRGGFWPFGRRKKEPSAGKPLLPEVKEGAAVGLSSSSSGGDAESLGSVEACLSTLLDNPKPRVAVEALASLKTLLLSSDEDTRLGPGEAVAVAERMKLLLTSKPRDKDVSVGVLEAVRALVKGPAGEAAAPVLEGVLADGLWASLLGGPSPLWQDAHTKQAGARLVGALLQRRPGLAGPLLSRRVETGVEGFLHPLLQPGRPLPVGLVNMGNTCYLNSVLQQLFATRPTRTALIDKQGGSSPSSISASLGAALAALSRRQGGAYHPRDVVQACSQLPLTYEVWEQNDASEFLMMLLDRLRDEAPEAVAPFEGSMVNRYSCESCGHERSARPEATITVQVTLKKTLQRSLADLVTGTRLDDPQKCGSCGARTVMRSQQFFASLPHTLVLQLARFQPGPSGYGSVLKVLERFEFPVLEELDLQPYTWQAFQHNRTSSSQAAAKAAAAAAAGNATSTGGNTTTMPEGQPVPPSSTSSSSSSRGGGAPSGAGELLAGEGSSTRYRLKGVVIHQGSSPHVGHYYSYTLSDDDGRWYCLNDRSVTPFDSSQAERAWFKGGHASPFLLFYERLPPTSAPASTTVTDHRGEEEEEEEEGVGAEEEEEEAELLGGGSLVAVPGKLGVAGVAAVLDVLRHVTTAALRTTATPSSSPSSSSLLSYSQQQQQQQRRRALWVTGRVLPWAMRLAEQHQPHQQQAAEASHGKHQQQQQPLQQHQQQPPHAGGPPHVEATRKWLAELAGLAAKDRALAAWVRRRMGGRGWLEAFAGHEEAAEAVRRAWVGLALAAVDGKPEAEAEHVAAMRAQALALVTQQQQPQEQQEQQGGSTLSPELRQLCAELGARDPWAMVAGLLQVDEQALRDKALLYQHHRQQQEAAKAASSGSSSRQAPS